MVVRSIEALNDHRVGRQSPRALREQSSANSSTCYDTLWEAVMSVDGAETWQNGLGNSGMRYLLEDPSGTAGVVLLAKDDGVLGCNTTDPREAVEWPFGECAQKSREWLQSFDNRWGLNVLLFHWLPNETFASLDESAGSSIPSFLNHILAMYDVNSTSDAEASLQFSYPDVVSLPPGQQPQLGRLGGYENATIVERVPLCNGQGGGVLVLDRPVYPDNISAIDLNSPIPGLEGYCHDSMMSVAIAAGALKLPAQLALTMFLYPATLPFFNPASNVTGFIPKFDVGELTNQGYVGAPVATKDLQDQIAAFHLAHFARGGYCPDDFEDGMLLQTIAGEVTDREFPMYIKKNGNDSVIVQARFGDNDESITYKARFVGMACHSAVYQLEDAFIAPWKRPVISNTEARVPFEYLSWLPTVDNYDDMFNVSTSCGRAVLTPATIQDSNASMSSLSIGAIIGIVIGSCVAVIISIFVILAPRFRKGKRHSKPFEEPFDQRMKEGSKSPTVSNTSLDSNRAQSPPKLSPGSSKDLYDLTMGDNGEMNEQLVLGEGEVQIDKDSESGMPVVLGQGKFGRVLRGTLLGVEPVAIKCIKDTRFSTHSDSNSSQDGKPLSLEDAQCVSSLGSMSNSEVLQEIALLKSCHSQFIVSFIGVSFLPHEIRLVTELMPSGDLWDAIGNGQPRKLTWYEGGIFIAMDVAAGLTYLHEKKRVIHLDLKSSNILLKPAANSRWSPEKEGRYRVTHSAKISDVGLSKFLPVSHEYLSAEAGGTWNWCAPEVILCTKCTPAADMFSYGVVLWELVTGERPCRGRMRRVQVPEECPHEVAQVIEACLNVDAASRPSAPMVFNSLQQLLTQSE